ncbi:MAG: amidase [Burkholderiales bacterium]|nr:amidase [Burkholderiales bacterium]
MDGSPAALWRLSAGDLGRGYRAGRFSPPEVLDAVLAHVARHNPRLNAIVTRDDAHAHAAAHASAARFARGAPAGPLDGVPVTVKDNIAVAGMRATWGSRLFAAHVPDRDELPVARLRAAGAIIVGKTNTPEFAMVGHTDNLVFGPTCNPWNPALSVGGSSGGAAAAVAAGFGPLALGTDGGGSIRRPASHAGLVGFKPSRGRVPRADGLPAIFLGHEVVGPIARTVEDAVLAMQTLSPPDARDGASADWADRPFAVPAHLPRCRILHVRAFGDAPVDPEIDLQVARSADALRALGHRVETVARSDLADAVNARWMGLAQAGLALMLETRTGWRELLAPTALANADAGRAMPATALFDLLRLVEALEARLAGLFAAHDFLLTPAAAALPWPVGTTHPTQIDGRPVGPRGHAVFTGFVNAAGLPAVALPCAPSSAGLPIGMQLIGRRGDDGRLLAIAAEVEADRPWRHRWPAP